MLQLIKRAQAGASTLADFQRAEKVLALVARRVVELIVIGVVPLYLRDIRPDEAVVEELVRLGAHVR